MTATNFHFVCNIFIEAVSGAETDGLISDAVVSDGEELKNNNNNLMSEVEFNIFTETEDEIKHNSSK